MPHKRAKRSTRESKRSLRGTDLAPDVSPVQETIPKSVSRVLDSARIRQEYREKKRKLDECEGDSTRKRQRHDGGDQRADGAVKIRPGESISDFNRRVEQSMVPHIKMALRQSSSQERKVRNQKAAGQPQPQPSVRKKECKERSNSSNKHVPLPHPTKVTGSTIEQRGSMEKGKEFLKTSTSAPRRLNDIVQVPPEITNVPRGAHQLPKKDKSSGVLSMAQQVMMEKERERAIKHYRELKARRLGGVAA
ncbi:hypothetical protein EDD17DRAFT_1470766 [Pisolithus thermaeus]|nr:hypothetical protein EDD17DRAFT_1470766 [Pisolithus thermaeus]